MYGEKVQISVKREREKVQTFVKQEREKGSEQLLACLSIK